MERTRPTELLRGIAAAFAWEWRLTARPRRLVLVGLFCLGPAGLAWLVRVIGMHTPPRFRMEAFAVLIGFALHQAVVPLVAMLLGSGLVRREVELKTLPYLFSGPTPRWAVLLGKFLAVAVLTSLLGGGAYLLSHTLYFVFRLPADHWEVAPIFLLTTTLGSLAYLSVFALLGVLLKRGLVVGVAYTLLLELILSNIPAVVKGTSITFHLRSILLHSPALKGSLEHFANVIPEPYTATRSVLTLLAVTVTAMGLAAVVVETKEFRFTEGD